MDIFKAIAQKIREEYLAEATPDYKQDPKTGEWKLPPGTGNFVYRGFSVTQDNHPEGDDASFDDILAAHKDLPYDVGLRRTETVTGTGKDKKVEQGGYINRAKISIMGDKHNRQGHDAQTKTTYDMGATIRYYDPEEEANVMKKVFHINYVHAETGEPTSKRVVHTWVSDRHNPPVPGSYTRPEEVMASAPEIEQPVTTAPGKKTTRPSSKAMALGMLGKK